MGKALRINKREKLSSAAAKSAKPKATQFGKLIVVPFGRTVAAAGSDPKNPADKPDLFEKQEDWVLT